MANVIKDNLHVIENPVTSNGGKINSVSANVSGLTASRAVVTDANKNLASSATTAAEIGHVNGVTSSIQTQLNGKQGIIIGTNNYVVKCDGTNGLQIGSIYDNGKIGIGTNDPDELLDIDGGIKIQNYEKYYSLYSVPSGTWVTVDWREGVSTLITGRVYRVTLSTTGTGSITGAVYVVRCIDDDPLTFEAKRISVYNVSSNAPTLQVDGTHLEVAQGHSSFAYNVAVTVEAFYHGNANNASFAMMGLENGSISMFGDDVGIGTETPGAPLEIYKELGARTDLIRLRHKTTGVYDFGLDFYSDIPDYSVAKITTSHGSGYTNPLFKIKVADASELLHTRISINKDGNVGIGTDDPDELLHIHGEGAPRIKVTDDLSSEARLAISADNGGFLSLADDDGNENVMVRSYGDSYFLGGNVGINITSPLARLDVCEGGEDSKLTLVLGANSGSASRTDSNNKIARIGIPHYDLDEEPTAFLMAGNTDTENILKYGGGTSYMNSATEHQFFTADDNTTTTGTVRVVFDKDGNVGIGTDDPDELLHIHGEDAPRIKITDDLSSEARLGVSADNGSFLSLSDDDGDQNVMIRSYGDSYFLGGNVGIGTSSPAKELHVNGTIRSDDLTASRVVVTNASKDLVSSGVTATELEFVDKTIVTSQAIADNSAVGMFEVPIDDDGDVAGGIFSYTIKATAMDPMGATVAEALTGEVIFNARGSNGDIDGSIKEVDETSSGSMTSTFAITVGSNKVTISCNANSSLSNPTITIYYKLEMHIGTFTEL